MTAVDTVLRDAFGHVFRDVARRDEALTHPSYTNEHPASPHYQRLELLGDAVVDLCTTVLLFARFPDAPEGALTDLRQRLVNTRSLGLVAERMGLAPCVRLGGSEARKRTVEPTILGDVVEALLGALYLEAGIAACQAVVDRWLGPLADGLRDAHEASAVKSPINRLQEFTQARWRETPTYVHRANGPDHQRRYVATAIVRGESLAEGDGATKKEATQAAARLALAILERREPPGGA